MRFPAETHDAIVRRLVEGCEQHPACPNMLVPWFLMAAFAYEELDDPFLTDSGYDWICRELDARWDAIDHRHKHLIDRAALRTGTASYLKGKLPLSVRHATTHLLSAYSSPAEIAPRAKISLDDLLGIPATSLDDLL